MQREDQERTLREQLGRLLDFREAHVPFDAAVEGVPPDRRGVTPAGLPHSLWQLVEHLRIAQHDILDFTVNPGYAQIAWPDDYWPKDPAPPTAAAWDESIAAYRRDRDVLQRLADDPHSDLFTRIPHGSGQTVLRELLLTADHAAYHIGQIVLVRRLLGIWQS